MVVRLVLCLIEATKFSNLIVVTALGITRSQELIKARKKLVLQRTSVLGLIALNNTQENETEKKFEEIMKKAKEIYKNKVYNLLVEGGFDITKSFLKKNFFNQFYLFKSNNSLKSNGSIKISDIFSGLNKNFKNKKILDTYSNKDKIIRYFNYV